MELLQDLFTELASNPFISAQFQTRMYPVLLESLSPIVLAETPGKTAVRIF
jgi:hypothetical protein